jgi:hypothetical protein
MKLNRLNFGIFMILMFGLSSCNHTNVPNDVQIVIDNPKADKSEIYKFIKHYQEHPKDSLKLKACYYILKNLDDRFYYEGDLLNKYTNYLKLIRDDQNHGAYYLKSFESLYGRFSLSSLRKKMDIETFRASDWIANVDIAFKVWKSQPWNQNLSFDGFCEYILPFRIDDEYPENNRTKIYETYNHFLEPVVHNKGNSEEAAKVINDLLLNPKWILTQRIWFLPHFPPSKLLAYKVGSCRDMADLAVYCMRATGIPVCEDFVPQWPYRNMGHDWNVVFNKAGKPVMFLGAEDSPGSLHKPDTKKGKIYRRTFAKNMESLKMQPFRDEEIPGLFDDSRIKDVTKDYVATTDIIVSLINKPRIPRKNAYLALYDDESWVPVDWGEIKDHQSTFHSLEGDIIYLPVFYYNNSVVPAAWPLLLMKNGKQITLIPDFQKKEKKISLTRVYPVIPDLFWVHNLVGGVFQASNHPNFADAVTLDSLTAKPHPFWNDVELKNKTPYRFYRYLSSTSGHCNIGELEFYSGDKKKTGQPMGTPGAFEHSDRTFDKAFDHNIFSFFDAEDAAGGWVGMDFKSKVLINRIRFSAATEKPTGSIVKGHQYELFYWNNLKQWETLGTQTAESSELIFYNMPSNALFRLHDLTENQKERIFVYANNKQVWY